MVKKYEETGNPVYEFNEDGSKVVAVTRDGVGKEVGTRVRKVYKRPMAPISLANRVMFEPEDGRDRGARIPEAAWTGYIENLRAGNRRSRAAKAVNMSYTTVRNRRKVDAEFAQAERDAEEEAVEVIEDALFESALKGNFTAQAMILNNRAPEKWKDMRRADKQVLEISGGVVHTQELGAGSLERIQALIDRINDREAARLGGVPVRRVIDVGEAQRVKDAEA